MSYYDDASLMFLAGGGAQKDGKAYSIKPVPVYGSELVTNGDFASNINDWAAKDSTIIWDNGKLKCNNSSGNSSGGPRQNVGLQNNKTYIFTATIQLISASANGTFGIFTSSAGGTGQSDVYYGSTLVAGAGAITETGQFTTGTDGDVSIQFWVDRANAVFTIDNVSVKEVLVGDGDFTFSRGSNLAATRVDAAYLIEKGRENLLLNSILDGAGANVAPTNYAITSFASGTFDVGSQENSIRFTAPTSADRIMIKQSPAITGVVTGSVYVEQIHSGSIIVADVIARAGGSSNVIAFMEDGVVVSSSNLVSVGKTYSLTISVTSAVNWRFGIGTSGPSTGDITLSKPQVEQGLVATDYIPTTTTTGTAGILENTPRFNYSNGASCPSLLLEPSRTNVVTNSEYLNGVEWNGKINVSFGTNQTISPEGLLNSASIIENTTNGSHFAYEDFTLTSGASYAISIYAKKNGVNRNLRFNDGGLGWSSGFNGVFDLTAGTATGGVMEDVGNGWYRCSVTGTTNATASRLIIYPTLGAATSYPGDGTSGVFLYGFQIEAGSYVSSYIPNHSGGGSVTRAADVCVGAGDVNTFNSTEGVLYFEGSILSNSSAAGAIAIVGTGGSRVQLYNSGTSLVILIQVNGVTVFNASTSGSIDITANHKYAIKWAVNDFSFWVDGVEKTTTTSGITFSADTLNELRFSDAGANYIHANTKQLLTFNTALSDADLATLTTI